MWTAVAIGVAFLVTLTRAARPAVMINGLPGAMGREVAAACLRRGLEVAPVALTGPGFGGEVISVDDGRGGPPMKVELYDPDGRDALAQAVRKSYPADGQATFICVDYTHPSAVNGNAEWYAAHKFPFVMGTTGGDREALLKSVTGVTSCVIAPNMAKQIVALQVQHHGLALAHTTQRKHSAEGVARHLPLC
jgi:4-hydroxy-tetrahydrodipicolinate reductase